MGRLSASLLALALGAVAAMALASCGGGGNADLLPGATANEITENLDQVKQLANEGECIGAEVAAQEVSTQVEALGGVDERLKEALREGTTRLNEVVETCEEEPPEETEAIETAEEPEPVEKPAKPKKSKPEKPAKEEPAEPPPTTPPPDNGEGEGPGKGEGPPEEPGEGGSPSGGVGPGTPAEGE